MRALLAGPAVASLGVALAAGPGASGQRLPAAGGRDGSGGDDEGAGRARAGGLFSRQSLDRELQDRWQTMKARLRDGDAPGALECIHSRSRARYEEAFKALVPDLRSTDGMLGAIRFVDAGSGGATYEMTRLDAAGTTLSFDVRFAIDVDDVWRIRQF